MQLLEKRDLMAEQDYFAITDANSFMPADDNIYSRDPNYPNREMWRVSLRLAALADINYGDFVSDLKKVVEPIMSAYRYRTDILGRYYALESEIKANGESPPKTILVLGRDPRNVEKAFTPIKTAAEARKAIDQSYLFSSTLRDLFMNRGLKSILWVDPSLYTDPKDFPKEVFDEKVKSSAMVILVEDHPWFDKEEIQKNSRLFFDCRNHLYVPLGESIAVPQFASTMTAMNMKSSGEDLSVTATYTGIVPIVYKAQGALLKSLIESIVLSFAMISVVMMLLLRDWSRPFSLRNSLNVTGGLLSMIPNIFPIVLIFGAMGFMGIKVDIGSMMTASVAMGIAVDDTIHFLNWYRKSLAIGHTRAESIRIAYGRCASAMTQTTLIAGLGLSVFALSTFAPTQRFGVLMLLLLAAALIGDLVILPAMLASPLGRFFGKPAEITCGADEDFAVEARDDSHPYVIPLEEHTSKGSPDVTEPDGNAPAKRSSS
jgi:hypothetical protein